MASKTAIHSIITPKQTAIDKIVREVTRFYINNLNNLEKQLKAEKNGANDSVTSLIEYIKSLIEGGNDKHKELSTDVMLWGALGVVGLLSLRQVLKRQFDDNYMYFIQKYIDKAQARASLTAYSQVGDVRFQEDIGRLRDLYIKDIENKILVENNNYQKEYLYNIVKEGKASKLGLLKEHKKGTERFFENELLQFNKDVNVQILIKSDYAYVEWVTMRDEKVRSTHRALNGKVFSIYDIPDEVHEWNCRCSLVGREKGE